MPKTSQEERILSHLKIYGSIEPMEALEHYGCFRLASRISDLRKDHIIDTETVYKDGKHWAKYTLGTAQRTFC